jgi:predicted Zn-dependent peptidase
MKKLLYTLAAIAISTIAIGQVDRSKLPEPGPAREIEIGDYESFELKNGMKVFVVENHKLPRVSFNLVFDRQPIQEGEKAGYLGMVGQMLRRGTTTRTKEQLDEEIDFIGASLGASSTSIYGSSLTKYRSQMLSLMTDILFNPIFPEEELDKLKTQTLSGLAAAKDDPNSISRNVTTVLVYGKDHPYGELTTEETVANISVDDIRNYYTTYFKPNIAYMAIVGDINKKEAQKLVKKLFNKWETGVVPTPSYDTPQKPEKSFVALVDKPSAVQSVVDITYPIELTPGTPEVVQTRVLNQILGGGSSARLFTNLREDKGYTYGAYSSLSSDRLVGDFSASASVRNEVTDSAIVEFIHELNRIKAEPVSQDELNLAINSISGSFARSLERPQTVASFAINIARYHMPQDYYSTYLKRVQAVTIADVRAMAEIYIQPEHAYITVVGKAAEIADKLTPFGEVKYYDNYGNEYTPSDSPAIPAGLTASMVINEYLKAIGGTEKLVMVEDLKVISKASIQGQELEITSVNKAPNKSFTSVMVGGAFEVQKSVFDGERFTQFMQGQKAPESSSDTQDALIKSLAFPEMSYEKLGVSASLKSVEKVNENYAYVIEIAYPSGTKITEYYDTESGLKVRQANYVQGPQGEVIQVVDFQDYQEVEGILFPHAIIIPLGGSVKMTARVASIAINKGVDDTLFKVD